MHTELRCVGTPTGCQLAASVQLPLARPTQVLPHVTAGAGAAGAGAADAGCADIAHPTRSAAPRPAVLIRWL